MRLLNKLLLPFILFLYYFNANGATFTVLADGNWNNPATWSVSGTDADGIPDSDDNVIINGGHTVSMNISPGFCNTLNISGGGTLDFNANSTLTLLDDLIISGTATISGGSGTRILNVSSNLTVFTGVSANIGGIDLTVTQSSSISGTLTFSSNTGVKTFIGTVSIATGGSWISTTITNESNLIFRNGIAQNGTSFTAGGATFSTNSQIIGGMGSVTFANVVTVNGVLLTNFTTVTMTRTGDETLTAIGFGTWAQGANSTLNYAGRTMSVSALSTSAADNTINYNRTGGGVQEIYRPINGNYFHLTLTSGAINRNKDLTGNTIVNGNLTVGSNATLRSDIHSLTVIGTTSVSGAISLNDDLGIKIFTGTVTINAGGSWNSTVTITSSKLIFQGGIVHNGVSFTGGSATFSTLSQSISGSGSLSFSGTVNILLITLTNNTTVSLTSIAPGVLTGTGAWAQGVNSTLNYSGQTITVSTFSASANGNTVVYTGVAPQTIFLPSGSSYRHLTISGSNTKSLSANTQVLGNLSIAGTAIFSLNGFNLSIAGNWSNSSTNADPLNEGTNDVTLNGSAQQSITNTGNPLGTQFFHLIINNGAGILLNDDVIINNGGTLFLTNGIITIPDPANDAVIINDNCQVMPAGGKASSFVDGPVIKVGNDAFVFPVGNGGSWARIGIEAPAAPSDQFTARYIRSAFSDVTSFAGGSNLDHISIIEHWLLNQDAGSNSLKVTLYWESKAASGISSVVDLRVISYTGSVWLNHDFDTFTDNANGTGNIVSETLSNFGPFTFGTEAAFPVNPLPVELTHFTARPDGRQVQLAWATASELNNDYFAVEHSIDGQRFRELGQVTGAGTTVKPQHYDFRHRTPAPGVNYYRLRQVDFDGRFEYSPLRAVDMRGTSASSFELAPNPADEKVTLNFREPLTETGRLTLLTATGRTVAHYALPEGTESYDLRVAQLPPGNYVVKVHAGSFRDTQRLVVE